MDAMNPILARKLGANTTDEAQKPADTPMRIMRRAMSRAADDSVGLITSILGIAEDKATAEELIDEGPKDWVVLGLRQSHNPGLAGLFLIDPALRSALIDMQTMGNLLPPAAKERPVTGTDATLSVPFAAALLLELEEQGFAARADVQTAGYDIGPIQDLRTAGLVLRPGDYKTWRLTLQLGGTEAQGELMFALRPTEILGAEPDMQDGAFAAAFRRVVEEAPTEMDAVLARLKTTLGAAEAFEVGQLVPLHGTTVGSVKLCGPSGETLASARLGQVSGKRAVRVEAPQIEMAEIQAATGGAAQVPMDIGRAAAEPAAAMGHKPEMAVAEDIGEMADMAAPMEMADLPDVASTLDDGSAEEEGEDFSKGMPQIEIDL